MLNITRIFDLLVIKKESGRPFISTSNSIIIDINMLAFILEFLIKEGFISKEFLHDLLRKVE